MTLLGLIVIVIGLGLIWYLAGTLPLPPQAKVVIQVVFILILILLVLRFFGVGNYRLW